MGASGSSSCLQRRMWASPPCTCHVHGGPRAAPVAWLTVWHCRPTASRYNHRNCSRSGNRVGSAGVPGPGGCRAHTLRTPVCACLWLDAATCRLLAAPAGWALGGARWVGVQLQGWKSGQGPGGAPGGWQGLSCRWHQRGGGPTGSGRGRPGCNRKQLLTLWGWGWEFSGLSQSSPSWGLGGEWAGGPRDWGSP